MSCNDFLKTVFPRLFLLDTLNSWSFLNLKLPSAISDMYLNGNCKYIMFKYYNSSRVKLFWQIKKMVTIGINSYIWFGHLLPSVSLMLCILF